MSVAADVAAGDRRLFVLRQLYTARDGLALDAHQYRHVLADLHDRGWVTPLYAANGQPVRRPLCSGNSCVVWVLTAAGRDIARADHQRGVQR